LQQFHLNNKYKKWSTNHIVECLIQPLVAALTMVIHSYGHETSEWPQIYERDPEFATTYHMLGINTTVTDFHLQDELLCHLSHLYVPSSKGENIILEDHYSRVEGHFGVENTLVVLHQHFYWSKI
jgi:hypothetical protein